MVVRRVAVNVVENEDEGQAHPLIGRSAHRAAAELLREEVEANVMAAVPLRRSSVARLQPSVDVSLAFRCALARIAAIDPLMTPRQLRTTSLAHPHGVNAMDGRGQWSRRR